MVAAATKTRTVYAVRSQRTSVGLDARPRPAIRELGRIDGARFMRIALLTTSFLPKIGGGEFVIHHLAQQWCRQGHDVRVINLVGDKTTHPEARYSVAKYNVLPGTTRYGYHRFPFASFARRAIARCLSDFQPDAISAHFGYPVSIWLYRLRPVPRHIITCHGPALNVTPTGPRQRYGISDLMAAALNCSSGAVAISTHARQVMVEIGVQPSKIIDIPNGADLERLARKVEGFDLRQRLGLPADALVVLSVGREVWAKAYDVGVRGFAAAARKHDAFITSSLEEGRRSGSRTRPSWGWEIASLAMRASMTTTWWPLTSRLTSFTSRPSKSCAPRWFRRQWGRACRRWSRTSAEART
jgi:hypothetical protein